jgi:hypothetical protein
MRSLVLCYSRTGTTKKVATALAESLGAELAELRCDRYLRALRRVNPLKSDALATDLDCVAEVREARVGSAASAAGAEAVRRTA